MLKGISQNPSTGLYRLDYDTPSGPATLNARSVAMTIPAWVLADLVKEQVGVRVCVGGRGGGWSRGGEVVEGSGKEASVTGGGS